ncbi:hypothetical protein AM501_20715 [Aneurinibacillus migulanus]|uniref:hypothetical protein n=1 Tax=Aneurinibacillus migulanus TaxID=47500 RepID=UPI0005BAF449|nr:hypothetical protein [Aneurinibacillus migulanus]KIV50289.1 hypothetical protein TS64_27255 [Aneurinibacillus migulanus]KPD06342.1 hypothetical protein AM501_20715 [Aneurinibacillus migulanus]
MKKKSFLLAILIALSLVLSACGGSIPEYEIFYKTLISEKHITSFSIKTTAYTEKEFRKIVEDIIEKNKDLDAIMINIYGYNNGDYSNFKAVAGVSNTQKGLELSTLPLKYFIEEMKN